MGMAAANAIMLQSQSAAFNQAAAHAEEFLPEDAQDFFAEPTMQAFLAELDASYQGAKAVNVAQQVSMVDAAAAARQAVLDAADARDAAWLEFDVTTKGIFNDLTPDVRYTEAMLYVP